MAVASVARLFAGIFDWVADGMRRIAAVFDPPPLIVAAVPVGGTDAEGAPLSLRDRRRRTHRAGVFQRQDRERVRPC